MRMTQLKIIMTNGDRPIMATQCLVLKTQEVIRCGGHRSFHYGSANIAINQPVEVTPQECRDALIAGKIFVQGQQMDFTVGLSHFHWYYSEGGRALDRTCAITTFTRKGVTYEKSYEETTIKVLISKVTQIPYVVACLETEDPNSDWNFLKALNHETVNLLTHMHFLHLSRGLGNFRRFEELQEAVCQVERKGLFNKHQALASGNKYDLHNIYGPGLQIYLAGSVAYVAQCIPVEARLYDPVNCTQQIPAEIGSEVHGNRTRKYANAQTMILQDFPTKVPCTWQYPPKWKIEDMWYCCFPTVQECNEAPTELNLTYDHTFHSMKAIFDGIKGGILTATQLQGSQL
jgi:hypothetical protein